MSRTHEELAEPCEETRGFCEEAGLVYIYKWGLENHPKAAHANIAEMTGRERKRKQELKEVLVKYGLGADLETLWDMGFSTHDIAWMSAEEMGATRG